MRPATPRVDGAWVEYDRGAGLTEWFVNLPRGVEQGWTVAERPAGGGPLVLELDTARPPDDNGDQRFAWSGLVYHRLVALDADGRELPAGWVADGTRLRIEVDDRDAAYPLLIDPWVEQAKLVAVDGAAGDRFGISVALSDETVLVGASGAEVGGNVNQGATYVFTRSGDTWSQQAKLVAEDGTAGDAFGVSVALAGDTALVGARLANVDGNDDQGAAYVFTGSGSTWSQQAKLTADDGVAGDFFGISVALAGDTALVGAFLADVNGIADQGAACIFGPELTPAALTVDPESMASDGNGVFEPGEMPDVAPTWRNNTFALQDLTGIASGFTGPPEATYTLEQDSADYGTLDPGKSASCLDTGTCYVMGLDDPAVRPATHWDATFDEILDDPDGTAKTWTLHIGDSFTDMPRTHLFYSWIETVLHHGVTSGCSETEYCPTGTSTRGQVPVFVLRAFLGSEFMPEPCIEGQERFADVPADHLFCPWIEELAERGVVTGCDDDNYCPDNPVTRAQMAVFLGKAFGLTLYGP